MEYVEKTLFKAKEYNITANDVIFAILVTNGQGLAVSYFHAYNPGCSNNLDLTKMARKKMLEFPQIKKIIKDLQKKAFLSHYDDKNEYRTKEGLINGLVDVLRRTEGKDRAAILMQLAKLQENTFENEKEEENRIHIYLPFNSDCRNCLLFKKARK